MDEFIREEWKKSTRRTAHPRRVKISLSPTSRQVYY